MNWAVTFYAAVLFFLLTPAVLVRLPPKGGKFTVAAVHALVFALIFHFTHKMVWQMSMGMSMPMKKEAFQEGVDPKEGDACPKPPAPMPAGFTCGTDGKLKHKV
jgi:hypothetical protein